MPPESGLPPDEPGKGVGKKASGGRKDAITPLRRAYEKVIDEEIPQPLLDLLDKLN